MAMNFPLRPVALLLVSALVFAAQLAANAKDDVVTAVFSTVYNGYARTRLADGKFKPETYAFGDGGLHAGHANDKSIDTMSFTQVARIVATPLAQRNYLPATDANQVDLLVMLYWGRTAGTDDGHNSLAYGSLSRVANTQSYSSLNQMANANIQAAAVANIANGGAPPPPSPDGLIPQTSTAAEDLNNMLMMVGIENAQRDKSDLRTAQLLGYFDALVATDDISQYVAAGTTRQDLISEVEEDRYYVILVALDFRTARTEKKMRPLWSTRFNISVRGNNFSKALPVMAQFASRYFGETSTGLVREAVPLGRVEIKELINVDDAAKKK